MKNKLLFSILMLLSVFGNAQTRTDSLKRTPAPGSLSLGVSYSRHGSGDLNGYLIDVGYEYNFKKRFSFFNNLAFSVHSDKDFAYDIVSQPNNPDYQSKPLIFVTTGLQTTPTIFYAVINGENQKFKIGAGPVFRYQENSLPDGYSYNKGNNTTRENYYIIKGVQPKIFTVGYKLSVDYLFLANPKNSYHLKAFYQNDTNGDLIVGIGISYAHRIKFF